LVDLPPCEEYNATVGDEVGILMVGWSRCCRAIGCGIGEDARSRKELIKGDDKDSTNAAPEAVLPTLAVLRLATLSPGPIELLPPRVFNGELVDRRLSRC
jgi:hypothetical protein